jgi:short-subunit dehydrogenase
MDLTAATCLITGANRGIGDAIARELAARPRTRILVGTRDPARYEPFAAAPGGAAEVRAVKIDLSSREAIKTSWEAVGDEPIDVLVNNAGLMTGGLVEDQDLDAIYAMFQVNLLAVVQLSRAAVPGMVKRGRGVIVNNASISGYAAFPAASTYSAAKSGVVAFSESLRRELRGTGVHVLHLVTPGVRTDMLNATEETYARHMDTSGWPSVSAAGWAARTVRAIESDAAVLRPGNRLELARLASRGPAKLLDALSARMFTRNPRD